MKITIFIPSMLGGGAERTVANLSNFLSDDGHIVKILTYVDSTCKYTLNKSVIRDYLFSNYNSNILRKIYFHLFRRKILKNRLKNYFKNNEDDIDIFLVFLEEPTILSLKLKNSFSKPIIVSERNYPDYYPNHIRRKLKRLCLFANGYVFQTINAREWYGNLIKNSVIIPNAVNDSFLSIDRYFGKRKKRIVTVGRLNKQKNQKLLIKAFSQIKNNEYTLDIYGEGPLKNKLLKLIKKMKLKDRVFLRGFSNDIYNEIKDATIFVLSSINEGIPNALIEAMAMGLPCITTNFAGGGAQVLIKKYENGIIVNEFDSNSLADAIDELIDNPLLCEKISNNAYSSIRGFLPNIVYKKWEDYINKIMIDAK